MSIKRRLGKLEAEADAAHPAETADEREKRLTMIREGAEQQNERFFRELARERRGDLLEQVGYGTLTADELRDENFIYRDDTPPFVIADDGTVTCSRDGRPVTTYPATIAEVWFWEEMEAPGLGMVYDEDAEAFYNRAGEFALSRDFADLGGLLGPNSG
ncbi:MAG: hypothetical protein M3N18_02290 [Actinomycetota bacterium]|nr:hypothetical protein [Actinomycetota bacterium]